MPSFLLITSMINVFMQIDKDKKSVTKILKIGIFSFNLLSHYYFSSPPEKF